MKNIVRVWIGDPYDGGHFNGTAFFVDEDTLVTAKHVVQNNAYETYDNIYLTNMPDGGITPVVKVIACERDLAVLKVQQSFSIEQVFFTNHITIEKDVNIIGFYDKNSSQKSYENRISGYQNSEHSYELQNHLTHGLSGSPIFLKGRVCGVATAINSQKNLTYLIPISELCLDFDLFKKSNEGNFMSKVKNLTLEQMGTLATIGATVVAIITVLILLFPKSTIEDIPESTTGSNNIGNVSITGSSNVTLIQKTGILDISDECRDGEANYRDTIDDIRNDIKDENNTSLKVKLEKELENNEKLLVFYKQKCK